MIKFFVLTLCVLSVCAGTRSIDKNARIVGGANARAGQFNFIAAITITTDYGKFFCSGALLDSSWLLTAGQCVVGATAFHIRLGSTSLNDESSYILEINAEIYFLHPEYDSLTLANDVGLIKFREWIQMNDYIRPINFLSTTALPDSSTVLTMGWGQTSDGTVGPVNALRYVYLETVSNNECKITYGNQITDQMVCVAGNFNEGTCLGDSGSPLVQSTASGQFYHVGISSFFSGNGCESPDPSGFSRTSAYVDWINNTTRNN